MSSDTRNIRIKFNGRNEKFCTNRYSDGTGERVNAYRYYPLRNMGNSHANSGKWVSSDNLLHSVREHENVETRQKRSSQVAERYNKGLFRYVNRTSGSWFDNFGSSSIFRSFQLVHQAISSVGRKLIPIGVVSSGFLLTLLNSDTASAFNGEMPKINIHNTPKDDGFFGIWGKIGNGIMTAFDWIIHLQSHLNDMTVGLFVGVYKFLVNFILCTPSFLFNNSAVYSLIATFSGASMFLVTILSMVEGMKKIYKFKHWKAQDSKKIWKRYLVALGVSGSAPFLFTWGFKLVNQLIRLLSNVGVDKMQSFDLFSSLHIPGLGILDVVLMLLFDIVLVGILIPISLQAGRRFWDLMTLSAISPLAMSAWIFDEHKHYFDTWWRQIKKLAQSQLVVAFFITIMGLFIFGLSNVSGNAFPALLLIIGGLYRMINVPSFVKSKMDHGDTIEDVGEDMLHQGKKLYDTLTLKNVRTLGMLKKRRQTGKRFNK